MVNPVTTSPYSSLRCLTPLDTLLVHQAYYGALQGAHTRLQSTTEDDALRSFLRQFTDRPGTLPPGVDMQPYTSGKVYGSFVVVTRTFPDLETERAGMVFTHALAVELTGRELSFDVGLLIDQLLTYVPPDKTKPLETLRIPATTPQLPPPLVSGLVYNVIQRLLRDAPPILVEGTDAEFVQIIRRIWSNLPLPLRIAFSFRASFAPNDLEAIPPPTVVSVQPDLRKKWGSVHLIKAGTPQEAVDRFSPAEQWLLGLDEENSFGDFVRQLEVGVTEFGTLRRIERAYALYAAPLGKSDCDDARQLVRFIALLSPSTGHGGSIKQQALNRLATLTESGTITDAKALRNLELKAFASGVQEVSFAVTRRVSHGLAYPKSEDLPTLTDLLLAAFTDSQAETWWRDAVRVATKQCVSECNRTAAQTTWALVTALPALTPHLAGYVPVGLSCETAFIETVPQPLVAGVSQAIIDLCKPRKWYGLHARVVINYLPLETALLSQLAFEKELPKSQLPGMEFVAAQTSSNQLLAVALANEDEKLVELAGRRCAEQPDLLKDLNVRERVWRQIWATALGISHTLTAGLTNPQQTIFEVLDLVGQKTDLEVPILKLIAQSRFANLLDYPDRRAIWAKLPMSERQAFVNATARALVDVAIAESTLRETPEQTLSDCIKSNAFVSAYLYEKHNDIQSVLVMQSVFSNVSDDFFSTYLRNYRAAISPLEVMNLGQMIRKHSWSRSAETLLDKAKTDSRYCPALHQCARLFTTWTKFFNRSLFNETISEADWWEAFTELVLELYTQGPEENHIWKRSGGNEVDFVNYNSREENWRIAIARLKRGGGGISATSLLREMRADYPKNLKIQALLSQ